MTFWNSIGDISRLLYIAQWAAVAITLAILILSNRKDDLKDAEDQLAATKIAEANATAQTAQKQNLSLQLTVEKERVERLRLQTETGFRTISIDQEVVLLKRLRLITGKVRIVAPNSSPESAQFAERIREVFVKAGWDPEPVMYAITVGLTREPGIVGFVRDSRHPFGGRVQNAFEDAGLELKGGIDPQISPPDVLAIVVGQKQ